MSRQDKDAPVPCEDLWRIRAETIEDAILRRLAEFLRDPIRLMTSLDSIDADPKEMHDRATALANRISPPNFSEELNQDIEWVLRVDAGTDAFMIVVDREALAIRLLGRGHDVVIELDPPTAEVTIFTQIRRRGVEKKILLLSEASAPRPPDPALVSLIGQAHLWARELMDGTAVSVTDLASRHGVNKGDVSRILPLAYLAPDIVKAILDGGQPVELTASRLKRLRHLPECWTEQRAMLGFS